MVERATSIYPVVNGGNDESLVSRGIFKIFKKRYYLAEHPEGELIVAQDPKSLGAQLSSSVFEPYFPDFPEPKEEGRTFFVNGRQLVQVWPWSDKELLCFWQGVRETVDSQSENGA